MGALASGDGPVQEASRTTGNGTGHRCRGAGDADFHGLMAGYLAECAVRSGIECPYCHSATHRL
jgi:hypothetical protein